MRLGKLDFPGRESTEYPLFVPRISGVSRVVLPIGARSERSGGLARLNMSTLAARDVIQQTTSRLGFRDFNSSDYERLVGIYNANYPDYSTSAEETRYNDERSDKSKVVQKRFPCVDPDSGGILAFARLTHN